MKLHKIFIVEDEKIIAKDLEIRLKRRNYQVVGSATNCDDALAGIASSRPDLILMDIMIDGEKDGIETAYLVKQDFDIPIIFLTAYADEATFQRAKLSDPFGYLIKPFQERDLDLTIQTVLQKHALEMRIKENEERYRLLFETTQEAICILNPDAEIVDCNPSAVALFKNKVLTPIGCNLKVLADDDGTGKFEKYWELAHAVKSVENRFKFYEPDGTVRFVEFTAQANYMPDRHLLVMRDATQKVRAQREIALLARIPAEAPTPMMRVSKECKLIYANRIAEEVFGNYIVNGSMNGGPKMLQVLQSLNEANTQETLELTFDGREYSLLAVYIAKADYVNIYASDVTEKKLSERLIIFQKEVMEQVAMNTELQTTLRKICVGLQSFLPGCKAFVVYKRPDNPTLHCATAEDDDAISATKNLTEIQSNTFFDHFRSKGRGKGKVEDLTEDPVWAKIAYGDGPLHLKACHRLLPIISSNEAVQCLLLLCFPEGEDEKTATENLQNLATRLLAVTLEKDFNFQRLYNQSLAFENINDAIILTDEQGLITEWSPAAERIFKYMKADMLGKRLRDANILAVETLPLPQVQAKAVLDGTPESHETAFVLPNGERGWVEMSYVDMLDPDGALLGKLQVARDITQKKVVERALNISEQHLKAIFDNSVQSIVLLDTGGKTVAYNNLAETWCEAFGSKSMKKGGNILQLWPTKNAERFRTALAAAKDGKSSSFEDPQFTAQDEVIWLELNFFPVLDEDGLMTGVCFTAIDIKDRKNSEVSLARSEARFRSLVQNSSDLILLVNEEGQISYASESCQRITGYSTEQLRGQKLSKFVHNKDKIRFQHGLSAAMEAAQNISVPLEYRFLKADGTTIAFESLMTNQLSDATIQSLVINSRDVSERKSAEDSLRNIVKGVSGYTGEDYFTYLTENLSVYLGIPNVLMAELQSEENFVALSMVQNKKASSGYTFSAKAGFAADVAKEGYLFVADVGNSAYESDPLMLEQMAQTVVGVALKDSAGRTTGILLAASPKAFENFSFAESMLKIFSVRASTELERIWATNALVESQANLSALIENTTDSIWSVNSHFKLTALNAAFTENCASLFVDVLSLGDDVQKMLSPTAATLWMPLYQMALGGKRFTRELSVLTHTGIVDYEINFNPILSEQEVVTGVSVFARDITIRKRAETALRESEANLVSLLENTDDIIYSLNSEFQLITANSSFKRTIDLDDPDDMAAQAPYGQNWGSQYERAAVGEKFMEEFSIERNGVHTEMETSFNPIFSKDQSVAGVTVFARDITERKLAENELKRTNFELDSFVYRASHDLRAPLRSVLGLLNLIKLEANEDQKNNFLGLAEKSINKLDTFISDLTHFSRNTRLEIANEPIDFNHIIAECIENLRFMERADRVEAHVHIEIEGQFYSDPQRLSIVFQNLISNAIKYQRNDVESFVQLTIKATATEGMIVVEDNGKGIHEEYLHKIFDMFFRASEESYGSGLGLYITRQVVEKLNGRIAVESTINVGTRFEIKLPNLEPVALEMEEKEES